MTVGRKKAQESSVGSLYAQAADYPEYDSEVPLSWARHEPLPALL
jgi:hypothetical protein